MSSNVPYYSASDPTVDNGKLYGASDPPSYGEPTYGAPTYDDSALHSKGPAQTKDGGADPKGSDVVEASVSAYPVSVAVDRPSQLAVATAGGDVIEYRIPQYVGAGNCLLVRLIAYLILVHLVGRALSTGWEWRSCQPRGLQLCVCASTT